jgi:hypothetical protein
MANGEWRMNLFSLLVVVSPIQFDSLEKILLAKSVKVSALSFKLE